MGAEPGSGVKPIVQLPLPSELRFPEDVRAWLWKQGVDDSDSSPTRKAALGAVKGKLVVSLASASGGDKSGASGASDVVTEQFIPLPATPQEIVYSRESHSLLVY